MQCDQLRSFASRHSADSPTAIRSFVQQRNLITLETLSTILGDVKVKFRVGKKKSLGKIDMALKIHIVGTFLSGHILSVVY